MAPRPSPGPRPSLPPDLLEDLRKNLGVDPGAVQSGGAGSARVFMGYKPRGGGGRMSPSGFTHPIPRILGLDEVSNQIYGWSDGQLNDFRRKLIARGLLDPQKPTTMAELASMWGALSEEAAKFYSEGRKVTPWDVLQKYAGFGGAFGGGPVDPGPEPFRREDVRITDPKTARALIRQLLQDRLGRDPSKVEYQSFINALQGEERESPVITSGIIDDGRIVEQTTRGGVDPGAFAQDYAEEHNEGEYGAYQASTTYMDALMQAIGAPV